MATIEQLEQRVLALEQKLTGSILDDAPYSSTHTGPEIDEATDRALPGGGIDQEMAQKEPAIESANYPGCYYRMVDGAQEWINPPMAVGVEYRTTELSMGKPVYVKLVNFGAIPTSGTTKSVEHGISNVQFVIHVFGTTSVGFSIPYGSNADRIYMGANTTHIRIENAVSSFDASAYSAYVIIKYTKTTD